MRKLSLLVPVVLVGLVIAASPAETAAQGSPAMPQQSTANFAALGKIAYGAYNVTGQINAARCPAVATVKPTRVASSCVDRQSGQVEGQTCLAYDPARPLTLVSDRCRNEARNAFLRDANGRPVSYTFFGETDCRAYSWSRRLDKINQVYIHNGGSGQVNRNTWLCRPAASQYTIDRDGTIHQHIGEERPSPHVMGDNALTLGIELATTTTTGDDTYRTGTRCNSLGGRATKEQITKACAPTPRQYQSLRNLLAAIASRTAVTLDEGHIVGHCEVEDGVNDKGHGDPRAFDWREVGLSNKKKIDSLKGKKNECGAYDYYP